MAVPSLEQNQGISKVEEDAGEDNVLVKHVAFFDIDGDGVVYPWETFTGFREIGCGIPLSTVAAFFVNVVFSYKTRPGKFPSPFFPIEIKNIAKAKHGSDSGVYDAQGRFLTSKFEDIFTKHAHTHPNALNEEELQELVKANRVPGDYVGWIAAYAEWKILYNLCKDECGFLHKDTIRGIYDGTLFEMLANERHSTLTKSLDK